MSDKYTCYHTQEYRIKDSELDFPIICRDSKAWLGTAYYFWLDEDFAHYWGKDFKNKTGYYSIYKCEIEDIETGEKKIFCSFFDAEKFYGWSYARARQSSIKGNLIQNRYKVKAMRNEA